jgi:hypothetical protein
MVGDEFGITKMYPSYEQNPQYFAFPVRVETNNLEILKSRVAINGSFSAFANASNVIGWWEYEPDDDGKDDRRITIVPESLAITDGNLEYGVDCDLNHEEAHNTGYINEQDQQWRDVEFTTHLFIKSVKSEEGYFYFEARNGYFGKDKSGCCQGTAYGARLYFDNSGSNKGKVAFYKKQISGNVDVLLRDQEPVQKLPSFYQKWFGVKFVVYNPERGDAGTNPVVRLELYLTPVEFGKPSSAASNNWSRVGVTEDRVGANWGDYGKECDAPTKDFPITWGNPFIHFGWVQGDVIQFNYTSFREIDAGGTFGEDPIPVPDPEGPGIPDPTDPGTPTLPPIDAEPPKFPTTLSKRLTIRREILNNRLCSCDGIQGEEPTTPPGGGTGGGGGGTGTLITLYNVALNTSSFARLASETGSTNHYLRFGQGVTQTNSGWIGKSINRVEITIAEQGTPTGGTGGGVHCRIRKGTDDSIAATLSPVATETEIVAAGKVFVFENLTNTYKLVFGDRLLFEYDGGDLNNFVKIFMTTQPVTTGTKIVWQNNDMDAGEYLDAPSLDICARVYTLTP